jgi:uncharacterized membrane protein
MPSAERSVTINRPAADVFAYIGDASKATEWRSGVVDTELVSGQGKGAVYKQGVRGPMGRRIAADYEITSWEVAKRIEFKAIAGPVRPVGGYKFSETGGKTKVTFWLNAELGGWKRFVLGRSVQGTMNSEMKALDRLKEKLEAGAPAGKSAAANSAAGSTSAPAAKPAASSSKAGAAKAAATPRTARRRTKAS